MPNNEQNIDKLTIEIESQASESSDRLKDLSATIESLRKSVAESAPELAAFSANLQRLSNETSAFNARASQTSGYKNSIADVKNLTSEMNKMAQAERTAADIEMERMQNEMRLNEQLAKPVASKKTNQADPTQMAAEMAKAQREAVPLIDSLERMDALYKQIDERVHSGVLSDVKFSDDMGWTKGKTLNISEEMLKEADALGVARQEIFDYANSLYSIYSSEEMAEQGARSFISSVKDQSTSLAAMVTECNTAEKAATDWIEAYNEASDAVERFGKKAEIVDFNEQTFATGDSGITQLNAIRDEMLARQQNTETIKTETKAVQDLNAAKSAKVSVAQGYSGFTAVRDVESLAINQQRESARAQDDITAAVKRTNDEINRTPGATRRAHKATQNWLSKLWQVTKRIIISRLIRTLVNDALNGAKEGLQNIVHFSDEANKAMSSLSTNTQYLKNSFAALATPILTLLMPAFDWLTDSLVDISNRIAEFFASLNGANTYTRALKATVNYVDTLGESTEKAAKAQRELIGGFDELNIFNNKVNKSSSGKTAEDYAKMFETADVVNRIKLADIGKTIADWLNSVPWSDLTVSFANKINSIFAFAFDNLNGFLERMNFGAIGSAIGEGFNNLRFDLAIPTVAKALYNVVSSAIDFAKGLILTINWKGLSDKIFAGLSAAVGYLWNRKGEIAKKLFEFLGAALGAVGSFAIESINNLGNWIVGVIDTTVEDFREDIEECGGNVGEGILKGIGDKLTDFSGFVDKHIKEPFVSAFSQAFSLSDGDSKVGRKLGETIALGALKGLSKILLGGVPNIFYNLSKIIQSARNGTLVEDAKALGETIANKFKDGFFSILNVFIDGINWLTGKINGLGIGFEIPQIERFALSTDTQTSSTATRRGVTSQSSYWNDTVIPGYEGETKMGKSVIRSSDSEVLNEFSERMDQLTYDLIAAMEDNKTEVNIGDDEIARSAARGGKQVRKQTGVNIFA